MAQWRAEADGCGADGVAARLAGVAVPLAGVAAFLEGVGLALVGASPYTMVIANRSLPDAVNVLFFALPGLIGGFGGVIQHIGLQALRQSVTPERLLGRVYASASVLGHVMMVHPSRQVFLYPGLHIRSFRD